MACVCFLNEWTLLLGAVAAYLAYKWSVSTFRHWEELGVPFNKPVPFFGGSLSTMFARENLMDSSQRVYNMFKGTKVYGNFEMRRPMLMIRDPELIKQLTVKDFDHFLDHRRMVQNESETLMTRNLFGLRGQDWRDMRATLSPVFTGSKMREMFELIIEVTDRAITHLRSETSSAGLVLDTKDMASRFTNDVIASTSFGLEVNSFKDKENDFFLMGQILASVKGSILFKILLSSSFPRFCKLFRIRLYSEKLMNKFTDMVTSTMKQREESGFVRRDVIQLLMQAFKGSIVREDTQTGSANDGFATAQESKVGLTTPTSTKWSIADLVAQCFIFFFAGFDSVANLVCFIIQELIENPDVQQNLLNEVNETKSQLNGKPLSYDMLQGMTYLDQVVSETLRKWPNGVVTDRVCTKPYTLVVDGKTINFKMNDLIAVPIYGIHRDPEYFPNPDKFDPERFSDENKHNIKQFTYMPFGIGPRNCIASRFALMESKALIYSLVSNFKFAASEKTQIPLKMEKVTGFSTLPEKGFWAKLQLRN